MNTIRKIICIVCFVFLGILLFGQGSITIYRDSYLDTNAACPKTEYQYWVDTKPNYGNYEWKITGGSFKHSGQNVKEINLPNISSVIVIWDNVKSSGGNIPKGTITLNVYDKVQTSKVVGNDKRDQDIKSLNDILPDNLVSDPASTSIPYGVKSVKVYLKTPLNYPGIKLSNGMPVPVNKYEWKIPQGWKPKTGEAPSASGTYFTVSPTIELTTNEGSGGDVVVRGVNDCANSNDYSVYSYPIKFTRSGLLLGDYPKTVVLGESKTYEFSVNYAQGTTFEWKAPEGWKINGKGNILTAGGYVSITTGTCYTEEKVKVGLSVNGEVSSLTEFPTTVALPAIKLPSGEIKQYESVTFSLDMPDTNIASVEWFVGGSSVGVATNTSSLSFLVSESGIVSISAKLTLEGCSPASIPEIEVDVTKMPDPYVSGPSQFCDQATYTIGNFDNLPPGTIINWIGSKALSIVSGQGTRSAVYQKTMFAISGTTMDISVVITFPSGQSIELTKEVFIGTKIPTILMSPVTDSPIPGPHVEFGLTGKRYWLHPYGTNLSNNDADYRWKFYSSDPFELPVQGIGRQIEYSKGVPGDYKVSLQYNGECGWSDEIFRTIRFEQGIGFSLYPNPAADMVTVQLQEEQPANTSLSTQQAARLLNTGPYEIQLWSSSAMLRRYTTDQPGYQMSVSGLPAGIYFVRVIKDGQTYTKKLIKK